MASSRVTRKASAQGKRGNGEGSISFNTSRGQWQSAVSFTDSNGLKKRKYYYGPTRESVAAKLATALGKQVAGEQPSVERSSLAAYLNDWLADVVKLDRSEGTYEQYESHCRVHIIPIIGKIRLTALSAADVEKVIAQMRRDAKSANTVRSVRQCLCTALSRAVRLDLIPRNPVNKTVVPKTRTRDDKYLSREQAQALIDAAEGHEAQRLWVLLLASGLRLSEALGLRWRNVDLDQRCLHLSQQLNRRRAELADLKTDKSRRTIRLFPDAVDVLRELRAISRQQRLSSPDPWPTNPLDDYVFSDPFGRPWKQNSVQGTIKLHARDAGLPYGRDGVTPHWLRHTCATWHSGEGTPLRVLQDLLGHTDLRMTARYAHVTPEHLEDAAQRLAAVFPSIRKTGTHDR